MRTVKTHLPKTRIISLVLSFLIIFYLIPTSVFAEIVDENTVSDTPLSASSEESTDTPGLYEVKELREENVKHFRLEDGTYLAAQYNYPVHYIDENGQFEDIDNRLVSSESEFATSNARIKFIKKITGNENIFTLHENNTKITMGLVGAEKKTECVVTSTNNSDDSIDSLIGKLTNLENISSTIVYEDILDGVDIEYVVHSLNIKENIIVKERKDSYSYTFTVELNNLSAVLSEDGNVYISTEDGEIKYVIPAPIVYDANGEYAPDSEAAYTLVSTGTGKYELTVTISTNWMNDSSRAFPVTIDPPIESIPGGALDLYIDSSSPDTNTSGEDSLEVSSTQRVYLKFDENNIADIPLGASIMKAQLNIIGYKWADAYPVVGAYPILTDWGSNLTWNHTISSNPQGLFGDTALDYVKIDSNGQRYNFDITPLYRSWASGADNYGVGLRLVDESSSVRGYFTSYNYSPNEDDTNFYEPVLLVSYIYNDGLESYFPTTTHSVGTGGAGSINLATGRLTLAIPTLTTTDSLFGFTPTLVYNSSLAGKNSTSENVNSPFETSYLPYGFKLNLQEFILKKDYYDEDHVLQSYYALYDADGTTHCFYLRSNGVYYDDEGLRLTMTFSNGNILITDANQTVKTYSSLGNSSWHLTSITDKYGNQLIFKFDSSNKPTKIQVKPDGMSKIDMLSFVYNGSMLCAVYNDASKQAVIFRYSVTPTGNTVVSGEKYLRRVEYYYGDSSHTEQDVWERYYDEESERYENIYASANYTYNSSGHITQIADVEANRSIQYEISNGKVSKLSEYAGSTLGQEVSYTYGEGYTDVRSTGNNETLNDADDIITRYIFDSYGRAVSAYSSSVDGSEMYGATSGVYETLSVVKNNIKETSVAYDREENYVISNNSGEYFATLQGGVEKTAETGSYTQTIFTASSLDWYNANMEYVISGFGYSNSIIQNENAKFSISAKVYYYQGEGVDDVVLTYDFDFADVENTWQFISGKIDCLIDDGTTTYDVVRKIDLVCNYYGQVDVNGTTSYAYFDRISFADCSDFDAYRYYYDPVTGNLIIKENYHHTEYYEYNDKNSITRVANNKGDIYDYVYATDGVTLLQDYYFSFHRIGSFPGNLLYYYPYDSDDPDSAITKTLHYQTNYTYNDQGLIKSVVSYTGHYITDGNSITSSYTYEETEGSKIFGAMLTATDSRGNITKYFHDSTNGNLLAEIDVTSGSGYVYAYDDIGRLESVLPATGTATSYSSVTNAENVEYTYDTAHRLSKINTDTTEYTFTYDNFGNSTSVSAGNNTLATYEYNSNNGKLTEINYGNGFSEEYEYNTLEKVEKVWYNYSDGTRTLAYSYEYNTDGTLKKFINHQNGETVEYTYDYAGRFVSSIESKTSDSSYKNEYEVDYDGLGRVTEAKNVIDYLVSSTSYDLSVRTNYCYNSNGTLKDEKTYYLTGGSAVISEYTYDELNRLTKNHRRSGDYYNTINYTYYSSGTTTANLVSAYTSNVNGTSRTFNYTYDSKGNIIKIVSNGNQVTYTYDDLGQLISETKGLITRTYEYDNAGNITSITKETTTLSPLPDPGFGPIIKTSSTQSSAVTSTKTLEYTNSQWGDLLTSFDGVTITYDAIGNPLSYYNGTSYTFTWEGRRLVGAVSGSNTMSFEYNDEGIRTSKTVNGVETVYYVNGGQIVAEKTGTRTIVYIYDASGTPIGMMYRTTSYAENIWDVFWYEKNLQGDIIAVYNSAGTKVATYTYSDAWGNHSVSYTNGGDSTGAIYNPFRYRSYYYDSDLGMYYLQSRYYDANICRFINADCYVSTGQGILSVNMYAYCGNNPVMGYDPFGMWTISFSFGYDITFFYWGVSGTISLSFDDDGNVAIQNSYSEPYYENDGKTMHLGLMDVGAAISFQWTNDDTIRDLNGNTTYLGGSVGILSASGGIDLVYSNHNPIKDQLPGTPTGFQVSIGKGVGMDVHLKTTYTNTIYEFNIRDLFVWR